MRLPLALLLAAAILSPRLLAAQEAPPDLSSLDVAEIERLAEDKFALDELGEAIQLYGIAASKQPEPAENTRLRILVAWLQHLDDQPQAAADTLQEALRRFPDYRFEPALYSQEFVDLYQQSKDLVEHELEVEVAELLKSAVENIRQGERATARQQLGAALEIRPRDAAALYNLALLDLEERRFDQAIAALERLAARAATGDPAIDDAFHAQILNNLGLVFYHRGQLTDAAANLERALELDDRNGQVWNNLGLTYRRLNQSQAAFEAFTRAVSLRPNDPGPVGNLGLAHIDAERWVEAVAVLVKATQQHPDRPHLWLNLALAQRGLGNSTGTRSSFEEAARLDPENRAGVGALALQSLASLALDEGDPLRAEANARRATALNPSATDAWIYVGLALHAQDRFGDAADAFQRALDLDPTRADAAQHLGNAYFQAHEYESAIAAYERALSIDDSLESAQNQLTLARARLGAQVAPVASNPPTTAVAPQPAPRTRPAAQETPTRDRRARDRQTSRRERQPPPDPSSVGLEVNEAIHRASGANAGQVMALVNGGAAARAGLEVGDLILRVDGQAYRNGPALLNYLASRPAGTRVQIDLVRQDQPQRLYYEP